MTNEEASFILANIDRRVCDGELSDALDVAIKALEQQPCKDCISRKQALKETKALIRGDYDPEYIIETLKMLPSVTPKALEQQPCDDAISRQAVLEQARDYGSNTYLIPVNSVKTLPSVKPTRPTGKWNFIGYCMFECSSCGTPYTQEQLACMRKYSYEEFPKYCPNCGAKMQEAEE